MWKLPDGRIELPLHASVRHLQALCPLAQAQHKPPVSVWQSRQRLGAGSSVQAGFVEASETAPSPSGRDVAPQRPVKEPSQL